MPWYVLGVDGEAFLADVRSDGWVIPFDWPAWAAGPDGERLVGHPEAVASASTEELARLLTTYVRGDRFTEGLLASAHENGMLAAIARRAAELAATLDDGRPERR